MEIYEADAVIIDFEDAVNVSEKMEARHLTESFLNNHTVSVDIYVRINSEEPFLDEDITLINQLPIQGVVVPKSTEAFLKKLLPKFKASLDVLALIETPNAFFELNKIAQMKPVKSLLLGAEDLMSVIGGIRDESGLAINYARSALIMAGRAHGKTIIDTPWVSLDENQLQEDIKCGQTLGFDGKMAIHPNQVIAINEAFSPSPKAIESALRILAMHKKKGSMRFSLDGKMVDKPIIQQAQNFLDKAKQYGLLSGENYDL